MGAFSFQSANRPEPLLISVKKEGDNTERFTSRVGSIINFDEDPGENFYINTITDANSNVSTVRFPLGCNRPNNCPEGPDNVSILSKSTLDLKYEFHGVGVTRIKRSILNSSNVIIDQKVDTPPGSIVITKFTNPLTTGSYKLQLEGDSCYSEKVLVPFDIIDGNETTLAWWPGFPKFDYDTASEKYRILMSINQTIPGARYAIKNKSNGSILVQGFTDFTPGFVLDFVGYLPGTYQVEVATLSADITIAAPNNPCPQGPTLMNVTPLNPTQTRIQFDALGVDTIEWFIRNPSDAILQSSTINPQSSIVTINHNALSPGSYNMQIRAANCTGQSGVTTDIDFNVAGGGSLDLTTVSVSQQDDGRYKLTVNFTGGIGNYTILVRGQSNNVIGSFPNTTGSPANVILPFATTPQTVKVSVIDANLATDEVTNVVLPPAVPKVNFLQADNFFSVPSRTPMLADGATYPIGSAADYNFDVEFVFPNGGLWDYLEKRYRKLESGTYVEKSLSAATGQPQTYNVPASNSAERLFAPRTGQKLTIDGQNAFKTPGTYEARFIARKGGGVGPIIGQITRTFTMTGGAVQLSGIILFNRNGATLGSQIAEIPATGASYVKPTPQYDLGITTFGGVQFNQVVVYFRQKVNDVFTQRYTNSKNWSTLQTTISPADWTLFDGTNFSGVHNSILLQANQTWQIEFVAYVGSTVVGSKSAIFNFTPNLGS